MLPLFRSCLFVSLQSVFMIILELMIIFFYADMDLLYNMDTDLYIRQLIDEPVAFSVFGIREALLLTPIGIHYNLLEHMQTRWNPVFRAYQIGEVFMCPTIEDFGGVLMSEHANMVP